jgi:hypothetical protein
MFNLLKKAKRKRAHNITLFLVEVLLISFLAITVVFGSG